MWLLLTQQREREIWDRRWDRPDSKVIENDVHWYTSKISTTWCMVYGCNYFLPDSRFEFADICPACLWLGSLQVACAASTFLGALDPPQKSHLASVSFQQFLQLLWWDLEASKSAVKQLPLYSLLLQLELNVYLHKQVKMGSVCHLFALLAFEALTAIKAEIALEYKNINLVLVISFHQLNIRIIIHNTDFNYLLFCCLFTKPFPSFFVTNSKKDNIAIIILHMSFLWYICIYITNQRINVYKNELFSISFPYHQFLPFESDYQVISKWSFQKYVSDSSL